jgi:hypothetical protein
MKPIMCAVLLLALIAPRASLADPPDTKPTAAADAVGRAHFQRGQRLSASGQYAAAYREFAAGYAATGRPLFLFNMAEAARASGEAAKARESYLEFLRVDPKSALAATARTRLAELDRAAGIAPPRPDPSSSRPDPSSSRPDPSGSRPDPSSSRPDPSGSRPDRGAPSPPTSPSVTTTEGARTEPIPLLPPSATRPQPSTPETLPPERFATTERDTEDRPLWKKWPFWAVVGGVVAGGAVVFAVTRGGSAPCADCPTLDFRN